jgi:hypothetical protein
MPGARASSAGWGWWTSSASWCDVDGAGSMLAREGRFDYLLMDPTGLSEPRPGAEPRRGRRTVLTFPLLPPPQKN